MRRLCLLCLTLDPGSVLEDISIVLQDRARGG